MAEPLIKPIGTGNVDYIWEVTSWGYIAAESLEDAKIKVKENVNSLVNDDYKYWSIKVEEE
tara:strand:- start:526 stop:708 length:183 start_codon:yes stop_codon:yes gene_type:complete